MLLSGLAAEIVIIDIDEKKAAGEVLDISHASIFSHETKVWAGHFEDCSDAAIVIITAGRNQQPGQSRMDLLKANYEVFKLIVPKIANSATDAILLVATNPVDVLTYAATRLSGFDPHRVIGSGTALDTARFRYELGQVYQVDPQSIYADIIGEHGDTELPVWSLANISGMRLPDYCNQIGIKYDRESMEKCFQRTKDAAYNIIQCKGVTDYGIATGLVHIVETILRDENTLITVSRVGSFFGIDDIALSVPAKVNRTGAHIDGELLLSEDEKEKVRLSGRRIKDSISSITI